MGLSKLNGLIKEVFECPSFCKEERKSSKA